MIAADSSVIVAGFATWHEQHGAARAVLDEAPVAVGHAMIEAYSVLTRLPAPHRAPAPIVSQFLNERFPTDPLVLEPSELRRFFDAVTRQGITGGAVYDALIATTAASAGAQLVTCDTRARGTYERIGCAVRMLV